MIYQTDEEFNEEIREFGCCFITLLFLIDQSLLTHEKVTELFTKFKDEGKLTEECFVQDPQGICDSLTGGNLIYKGWNTASYPCVCKEVEQQVWYNPNTKFYHFVVGDGKSNVVYDPIKDGSFTVRYGYLESKRIYRWT